VITGNVKNFGAVSGFVKNRLHDLVINPWPVPFFLLLEQVDNIAHQIQILGFSLQEKIEQLFVPQVFFAQVQV
jgi:hypothetical protein